MAYNALNHLGVYDMNYPFSQTLREATRRLGPVCVGLDPRWDRLPDPLRIGSDTEERLRQIEVFCYGVLEAVAGKVPAVKPQSAYFEAWGPAGVELYSRLVVRARSLGLLVIGDVKRNDIGSTAEAYAIGHLLQDDAPDAITVNGYLGRDGLEPFIEAASKTGRGLFVLVRTSNPSALQIQDLTDADGKTVYVRMAELVARLGQQEGLLDSAGTSCVGAVVGATWPEEARMLRQIMPEQTFLVPGYGAQGATADDCMASFRQDGSGAIVNASRSVIYAHARDEMQGLDWQEAVEQAAEAFAEDLRSAVARRFGA
jgi:orotidine-5'-phosphate decarboxylase